MKTSDIIGVVDVVPGDALGLILLLQTGQTHSNRHRKKGTQTRIKSTNLFKFKNVLVEVILKLLVGVVDAELLEAVGREVFEAEDIEHTDG